MRTRGRRLPQFGLSSLFGLTALVAVGLGMDLSWQAMVFGLPAALAAQVLLGFVAGWIVDAIDWLLTGRDAA